LRRRADDVSQGNGEEQLQAKRHALVIAERGAGAAIQTYMKRKDENLEEHAEGDLVTSLTAGGEEQDA